MGKCRFCGLAVEGHALGGHVPWCSLNPNLEKNREVTQQAARKRRHSPETRAKMSMIARTHVENGTWHNSFSRSRTYEYKGIKLYGKWELAYAQWLDENEIKWRRPKESFQYDWNGTMHRYTPDFFLLDEEIYVEVKGYETDRDRAKWSQFPLTLKVLHGKDLFEMGLIKGYKKIELDQ